VTPAYRVLAEELIASIRAGKRLPGERLPTIAVLAGELGVSASVVQGAYDLMFARGWVVRARRRGTFVAADLPGVDPRPSLEERLSALEAWRARVEGERGD